MTTASGDEASSPVVVIFLSTRTDHHLDEYQEVATAMEAMARQQPGFLRMESARDPTTGRGITVSRWVNEQAALAWKEVTEHLRAQQAGRHRFYLDYEVIVARQMRAYTFMA